MPTFFSSSSLLIPGLPNDEASQILSIIPFPHHLPLKRTCKSWHQFFSSKSLIPLRHHLRNITHLICLFPGDPSIRSPFLFDPISLAWRTLPLMPASPNTRGRTNFGCVFLFPHLYVLGGSVSTTPKLSSSSSGFRFDFITGSWDSVSPMLSPRGSFACAAISRTIVVAGGWLNETDFGVAGRRMRSAESYNVVKDKWEVLEELPEQRAGCIGFVMKEKGEFWVIGGNRESMNGVFSTDVYCKDAVAMDLEGKWREVANMQLDDGTLRTAKIAVVENEEGSGFFVIFMLHESEILRYDMKSNSWVSETTLPTKIPNDSVGFIALGKELLVMSLAFHGRTKHIDIRFHFIRELVGRDEIVFKFCSTNDQVADIFTKALPYQKHVYFRSLIALTAHFSTFSEDPPSFACTEHSCPFLR